MVFKRRDSPHVLARLREVLVPRRGWRRGIEYLGHRFRRLPDTPHRIALGFACGVVAAFTPFFGLHFILAAAAAQLVRGNMVASLIGTSVGNPLTYPLIASMSLGLGRRILGYGVTGHDFRRIADAFWHAAVGLLRSLASLVGHGESQWDKVARLFVDVVWPYCVGALLPGLVAGIAGYYLTRPLVAAHQARRRGRKLARAVEATARRKSGADATPGTAYMAEK